MPGALKGEARANAFLKAVTKAKRRVTLSICGLGLPTKARSRYSIRAPSASAAPSTRGAPPHNPTTGEVLERTAMIPAIAFIEACRDHIRREIDVERSARGGIRMNRRRHVAILNYCR